MSFFTTQFLISYIFRGSDNITQWNKNSLKGHLCLWRGSWLSELRRLHDQFQRNSFSQEDSSSRLCTQSCLSVHELLLIWRKSSQNNSKFLERFKTRSNVVIWSFWDEFSKYLPSQIFSYSSLLFIVPSMVDFPLGIRQQNNRNFVENNIN